MSDVHLSLTYSKLNISYANTSTFMWDDIHFINISGTSQTAKIVDFECSSKAPCAGWTFEDINLATPNNTRGIYICQNFNATGLDECQG